MRVIDYYTKTIDIVYKLPPVKMLAEALWNRPISPRELVRGGKRCSGLMERAAKVDLRDKLVVLTGASSGMGKEAAVQLASLGARVILVARREEELHNVATIITTAGGTAYYYPLDVTDYGAVENFISTVLTQHGVPDIVINNAGRSIRRSVIDAVDRYHDYQRTMAVNYFSAVQLTLGFLPGMLDRGSGQFINISSWGVPLSYVPLFSAYLGSKAALHAFGRSVDLDTRSRGVCVTMIYPPLVKTPMTAPTESYKDVYMLSPEQAAEWIVYAARNQPREVIPRGVRYARMLGSLHPGFAEKATLQSKV